MRHTYATPAPPSPPRPSRPRAEEAPPRTLSSPPLTTTPRLFVACPDSRRSLTQDRRGRSARRRPRSLRRVEGEVRLLRTFEGLFLRGARGGRRDRAPAGAREAPRETRTGRTSSFSQAKTKMAPRARMGEKARTSLAAFQAYLRGGAMRARAARRSGTPRHALGVLRPRRRVTEVVRGLERLRRLRRRRLRRRLLRHLLRSLRALFLRDDGQRRARGDEEQDERAPRKDHGSSVDRRRRVEAAVCASRGGEGPASLRRCGASEPQRRIPRRSCRVSAAARVCLLLSSRTIAPCSHVPSSAGASGTAPSPFVECDRRSVGPSRRPRSARRRA